jgi:hypothetical protein
MDMQVTANKVLGATPSVRSIRSSTWRLTGVAPGAKMADEVGEARA